MRTEVGKFIAYQATSMSSVKAEFKFREEGNKKVTYINTPAGLLIHRTKKFHEMEDFRNDVVNKVSKLIADRAQEKEYFKLVAYARDNYKVEWKANMHTRLKSLYVF